jgi:D-sedoheptulose 7-phosphate isomerase
MTSAQSTLAQHIAERLLARNAIFEDFFAQEAARLASVSQQMAKRFERGGRLLAFGRGACATDAQHVSVEFVHPVIVGKRALPGLDISAAFAVGLNALVQPDDIVMGFAPPQGDAEVQAALDAAQRRGALTLALSGDGGSYWFPAVTDDAFINQELIEVLYHTLWETVHVFLEHRELGQDAGAAGFLYPFLGGNKPDSAALLKEVAESIRMKVRDDARLRTQVAEEESEQIAHTALAINERIRRGGKLILFGNGGSATDANDWAIDCIAPPSGWRPVPAISLALEPANISAIANDVGIEVVFLRQLIAHARPEDVAVGISTSGGSRNIIAALEEARKRGLLTVALLGYDGGEILRRGLADFPLIVRCDYIPRIQEVQASIYHSIRAAQEEAIRAPQEANHA